jgi:hypothetical protein
MIGIPAFLKQVKMKNIELKLIIRYAIIFGILVALAAIRVYTAIG